MDIRPSKCSCTVTVVPANVLRPRVFSIWDTRWSSCSGLSWFTVLLLQAENYVQILPPQAHQRSPLLCRRNTSEQRLAARRLLCYPALAFGAIHDQN